LCNCIYLLYPRKSCVSNLEKVVVSNLEKAVVSN